MLHTIFDFFQQYRFWIYMGIALIGFVIYCVSEHLRKKERNNPGSIAKWKEKTIALYIASLVLMIGVVVAFALDGYYDRFFGWFIG